MHRAEDVISYAVIGLVGLRLLDGARRARSFEGRSLVIDVVRGIRWRHIWPVPFVLAGVVLVAIPVLLVPGMDWGWWSALGGDGNPVFGSSTATTGSALEWIIPLVFIALLLPALPLFANAEERVFRAGAEHWSPPRRALKVVQFGLVHALIGIPIGWALSLSVGGAYFMFVYLRAYRANPNRREATLESTRAHTAYNGCLIVVVVLSILISLAID